MRQPQLVLQLRAQRLRSGRRRLGMLRVGEVRLLERTPGPQPQLEQRPPDPQRAQVQRQMKTRPPWWASVLRPDVVATQSAKNIRGSFQRSSSFSLQASTYYCCYGLY